MYRHQFLFGDFQRIYLDTPLVFVSVSSLNPKLYYFACRVVALAHFAVGYHVGVVVESRLGKDMTISFFTETSLHFGRG
jgi:hypothetical protein